MRVSPELNRDSAPVLARLRAVLEAEHAALIGGDADAIERLAAEKLAACRALEALLSVGDLTPPLKEELRRLEEANRANGALVGALLQNAEAMLSALGGAAGGSSASVYRGDGQAAASLSTGRPLGKA